MAQSNKQQLITPRLETNDGFITAQQVRDIRAQLKRMSQPNNKLEEPVTIGETQPRHTQRRIDTEHRGVTGTLVLTDVLDEKVSIPSLEWADVDGSTQICRIWKDFRRRSFNR